MSDRNEVRAAPRAPCVWIDVTTSLRNRGSHATGTLRVERELSSALSSLLGEHLVFCRYNPVKTRFERVNYSFKEQRATPPDQRSGPGARRKETAGKRVERILRLSIRKLIRHVYSLFQTKAGASGFPESMPGDVLFLGGETWSQRYDFEVIRRIRHQSHVKVAAICQDLIPINFPQFFQSAEFIRRYEEYTKFLLRDVDLLITHSQSVRADLEAETRKLGISLANLSVVELGSDVGRLREVVRPPASPPLVSGKFVISVSTIQSRKNFDLLYRLWRRFAEEGRTDVPRLVIVGQQGFGSADLLWQIANDPRVRDNILVIHSAGDAELTWLYQNCCFTLYPSFAEGWGLPVAESLSFGKPCLSSNASSLPEAGAGLAVHLDPLDFKAWHDKIIEWTDDPTLLAELSKQIDVNYRRTTWSETATAIAGKIEILMR